MAIASAQAGWTNLRKDVQQGSVIVGCASVLAEGKNLRRVGNGGLCQRGRACVA